MRMTRAQAAALAAAEAEAEGAEPGATNDINEHEYDDTKNGSTTPTGEAQEPEALADLTTNLDTSNAVDDQQELDNVESENQTSEEQTNGNAENSEQEEQQGMLNSTATRA
ncbi:unnamed protein product [Aureobasidium mustum]|uniref:Uncharacterized protein n=1 Tax=Aureobasidium mustum TaxID=2773714 RepID=A0A9N8JYV9_9PEZI|nr:unnamed protein product [Aureobasidium mustum]